MALLENVISKLLGAGWIENVPGSSERDVISRRWTAKGRSRLLLVRHLIEEFHLEVDDDSVMKFTCGCRADGGVRDTGSRESARSFWVACLEETGLENEHDSLMPLVRLIHSCRTMPDGNLESEELASLRRDDTFQAHGRLEKPTGNGQTGQP